ncbi:TPA: hypothetical protein ACJIKV_004940 [Citrobacter freundii]
MKKIALFIAAVISAPALAWTNGDITKELNFGGSITPEEYSQLWRWKVGTGLNDFRHNISDMTQDLKKLTITMESPKGLLYGETVKAITATEGMGATPNIAFTDYEKNTVTLEQDSSDDAGRGHMTLPIKDEQNNKIGTLKLNLTAVGIAAGPRNGGPFAVSIRASDNNHALNGGLFSRSVSNAYREANGLIIDFGAKQLNDLRNIAWQHPLLQGTTPGSWASLTWAAPIEFKENPEFEFTHGITTASYVLGINTGQTMEATFDSPLTATTKWSAPLNVAVTYN